MSRVASRRSDWTNPILHADLDAFYASVEELRDPALRGKPVVVGGTSSRGVVTSASYEARRFGVRSAMPTSRARRLCPHAIFIQPDFKSYTSKSREVRDVFESFSPVIEPLSLDEAFIDVRAARRMWANPPTIAEALRDRVLRCSGLVVSVGVAPNKFLAKLASRQAKPDGVVVVDVGKEADFLDPLPVTELWGVGEQTAAVLHRLGLEVIGDIRQIPRSTLTRALGPLGGHISDLASGRDDRPVVPDSPRKSVGAEETFEKDLIDGVQIAQALLKLSDRVSARLRGQGISGRTVSVKIRMSNFSTITRSETLRHDVDGVTSLYGTARSLVARFLNMQPGSSRIRLLGISVTNLALWPASEQLTLDRTPRWADADKALDKVRLKFGDDALGFASLLDDL